MLAIFFISMKADPVIVSAGISITYLESILLIFTLYGASKEGKEM